MADDEARLDAELARLRDRPSALDRLLEIAHVDADGTTVAAETGLQHVLDRLRAGNVPRPVLARLARVVSTQLDELERDVEAAHRAHATAVRQADAWVEHVATALRDGRPDLADQARAAVAHHRASVDAAEAVLFEYGELRDQLREVGRLVLAAAQLT